MWDSPTVADLSNFLSLIDDDGDLAAELIAAFRLCINEQMHKLTDAFDCQDHCAWRDAAHSLKGVYLNLGAAPLGDLCRRAQHAYDENQDNKRVLLSEIRREDARLQAYLVQFSAVRTPPCAREVGPPVFPNPAFESVRDA